MNLGKAMTIRENLIKVLDGYALAKEQVFANHPIAKILRDAIPNSIRAALPIEDELLLVKGSAGQGNWSRGPWVAIFNRLITASAQKGFYPVYLFREDFKGVYLSLNQGVTQAKEQYRADAKTALKARAENFRAILGPNIQPFSINAINLNASEVSNDTSFYEAGSICSIFYPVDNIPPESQLIDNLRQMLGLYEYIAEAGGADTQDKQEELEAFFEGNGLVRTHLRVERNRKLAAKVKKLKGFRCEVCDLDFSEKYGDLGKDFIEAHHLTPFALLKGKPVPLDPRNDFAVLCANCHRMIHRMQNPADISGDLAPDN
jgi:5-methylcytosine-specific restriction protein A